MEGKGLCELMARQMGQMEVCASITVTVMLTELRDNLQLVKNGCYYILV